MKKQTKLEKRRKTVLGAVLGFGAVALLTTATATWIIAVNNSTSDEALNVTVDSAINNAVNLIVADGTGDMKIRLAESATVEADGNKVVITDDVSGDKAGDLSITLPDITVEYGEGWLGTNSKIVINLALEYTSEKNIKNLVSDDKIGKRSNIAKDASLSSDETATTYWTYLSLPTDQSSFSISKAETHNNGVYTVELKGQEVNLEWGSFFDNKSPAEFYNSLFTNGEPTESQSRITLSDSALIKAELDAMNTALTGDSLTITISVSSAA